MMTIPQFDGVFSVLPTLFTQQGEIDRESLECIIDVFLKGGVKGFTALGVTSEVARLTERERRIVTETILRKVNRRVPVVVGATAEGLMTCIEFAKAAEEAGASAVMVSPPRMSKLNSEAVVRHFRALGDAIHIPIVVQDYPPISGFTMEPPLLVGLAREVPLAQVIKLEDPPTPLKVTRIRKEAQDLPLKIFGGLGGMYLFEELMAGANGAMTGFAYPEILVNIVQAYDAGEIERAAETFYRYVPLMRFEFQEGIGMAIRKEMLRRRGIIANAAVRAPGAPLDVDTSKALDRLLHYYEQKGEALWI